MPVNTPLSPRVRAISNERVDLPDFNRLQDMVDQTVRRNMGGLMGYGSGLLTPFKTTYDAGAFTVTFGPFQYLLSEPNNNMRDVGTSAVKAFRGGVYDFVPNAASQTATWSLAAARAKAIDGGGGAPNADAYPFVFVRPQQVQTDTESRVAWVAGAETPVSIKAQLDLRHEFMFSANLPADTEGWACIGKVTAWSNVPTIGTPTVPPGADPGTPTIVLIAAWDSREVDAGNNNGTGTDWYSGLGLSSQGLLEVSGDAPDIAGIDYTSRELYKDFGLLQLLGFMRGQIQRIIDSDKVMRWTQDPSGVNTISYLSGGLLQIWNKLAPMWQRFNTDQTVLPWASGCYSFNPGPNTYTAKAQGTSAGAAHNLATSGAGVVRLGAGWVSISLTGAAPTGWRYSHVVVAPRNDVSTDILVGSAIVDNPTAKVIVWLQRAQVAAGVFTGPAADMPFDITVFITKDV